MSTMVDILMKLKMKLKNSMPARLLYFKKNGLRSNLKIYKNNNCTMQYRIKYDTTLPMHKSILVQCKCVGLSVLWLVAKQNYL